MIPTEVQTIRIRSNGVYGYAAGEAVHICQFQPHELDGELGKELVEQFVWENNHNGVDIWERNPELEKLNERDKRNERQRRARTVFEEAHALGAERFGTLWLSVNEMVAPLRDREYLTVNADGESVEVNALLSEVAFIVCDLLGKAGESKTPPHMPPANFDVIPKQTLRVNVAPLSYVCYGKGGGVLVSRKREPKQSASDDRFIQELTQGFQFSHIQGGGEFWKLKGNPAE